MVGSAAVNREVDFAGRLREKDAEGVHGVRVFGAEEDFRPAPYLSGAGVVYSRWLAATLVIAEFRVFLRAISDQRTP